MATQSYYKATSDFHYTPPKARQPTRAPQLPRAPRPIQELPVIKIYIWQCGDASCRNRNECISTERGRVRTFPSGVEIREPYWVGEPCEACRKEATKDCMLVEAKIRTVELAMR
jgi:hypothetical protein